MHVVISTVIVSRGRDRLLSSCCARRRCTSTSRWTASWFSLAQSPRQPHCRHLRYGRADTKAESATSVPQLGGTPLEHVLIIVVLGTLFRVQSDRSVSEAGSNWYIYQRPRQCHCWKLRRQQRSKAMSKNNWFHSCLQAHDHDMSSTGNSTRNRRDKSARERERETRAITTRIENRRPVRSDCVKHCISLPVEITAKHITCSNTGVRKKVSLHCHRRRFRRTAD